MKSERSPLDCFNEMVDGWVLRAVEDGVVWFGSLVCALPGVYPSTVRDSIHRLRRSRTLRRGAVQSVLSEGTVTCQHPQGALGRLALPMPHPLDFDWRYAPAAIERLVEEYARRARSSGCLVVLGAPSIVPAALWRKPSAEVIALDANKMIIRAITQAYPPVRAIVCDVMREALPAIPEAAVVIADPPWYSEHLHSFLWAACRMCRLEGHVLMSLPPLGTRPGIAAERADFVAFGGELGLRLVGLYKAALPYISPPFEQNALRADGIACVPVDWRSGDLAVFARVRAVWWPRPVAPPLETLWHDAEVRGVGVRMRPQGKAGFIDPRLVSLIAGDILPTVSRRDARREAADVWTTGNRVFQCRGTGILQRIIEGLGANRLPVESVADALGRNLDMEEANLVKLAAEQASKLISMEKDEQSSWREYHRGKAFSAAAI